MRVALITGEYPPMQGGVGAFTHLIAAAMAEQQHTVQILTSRLPSHTRVDADEEGMLVHRAVAKWGPRSLRCVSRWMRQLDPDVVNIQYEPAAYGMRAAICFLPEAVHRVSRAAVVVTFHDLLPPYVFPKAGPLRQKMVWRLARHADGVIVTNHEDKAALQNALGDSGSPQRLIPIGSNISPQLPPDYDREAWRARQGFDADDVVVGFFGFMNRTKGIETLIAAVAELVARGKPIRLLFIGGRTGTSDPTNVQYADSIDVLIGNLDLADRVHRTGFASPEEVSAAFGAVDVCALPYCEGANLRHGTLHAALCHGCATVTTSPSAPLPELEDGVNAVLVPPEDPAALAGAIERLADDEELRRRLGGGAVELAYRFSWPEIAAETAAFFRDLTEPARSGSA